MDFFDVVVREKPTNYVRWDYQVSVDYFYTGRDFVCKGGQMVAYWDGKIWKTDRTDLRREIDATITAKWKELSALHPDKKIEKKLLSTHKNNEWAEFIKFEKQADQSDALFNQRIIFKDSEVRREDYATHILNYKPEEGPTPNFNAMMAVLYNDEEIHKILWFIGALMVGDMKKIQKFLYLFGGKGTGKGTIINIFKMLFEGYYGQIDLNLLTSTSEFATGQIREVPLLVDEDTDISAIKKDTNLLKLTAHEPISVNRKYANPYEITFNGLLITASNEPFKVKHIDAGITRRAIVVEPTGEKLDGKSYSRLMSGIGFEIPQIAYQAIEWYKECGPYYYNDYLPIDMLMETDYMFNFMNEYNDQLGDPVSLKTASVLYKTYLDDIGFDTNGYKRTLKRGLKRYYKNFDMSKKIDGITIRNVFSDLKMDAIHPESTNASKIKKSLDNWIVLSKQPSVFDEQGLGYPAQYATQSGTPEKKWSDVRTHLGDIETDRLHYVRVPQNHIVIDFDLKDSFDHKSLEVNLEAAALFPPTYAEVSKSGQGVHLHYIYDGDVNELSSIYDDDIEVKVYKGNSSLRRKLSLCNDHEIVHIYSGLPLKEENKKVYSDIEDMVWTEKKMRTAIKRNLMKEYHANTKPSIDFIGAILKEAETNELLYDLRDMRNAVLQFATNSSNNADYCVRAVSKMKFSTMPDDKEDLPHISDNFVVPDEELTFYDVEIFPNLFVVCFSKMNDKEVTKWINPTKAQIESLLQENLVGFNNRKYDNHMLYGRLVGESNYELYKRSQILVSKNGSNGYHKGAANASYVDIYDYSAKKQSLKKWEIEMGIKHDEMEIPWDESVPEELWDRVAEYCGNDVEATMAVFKETRQDYLARILLSKLSGCAINDSTQTQAARFLFGNDPRPQDKFNYTDLSEMFPGYKYEFGKSTYRGEEVGEGGYVYSEPGVYENVVLADIESMHPHSAIALEYFGPYAQRFEDLVKTRMLIKHKDFNAARKMFDGILAPYLEDETKAKELAYALKIIINIVYGLTSAKWDNKFKHKDNIDNIIAKRGALFMINLKHEVQARGGLVAHIKTDSIKIPNASDELIDFIIDYGHQYGYNFDIEHIYKRMALVNRSTYIAEYDDGDGIKWEATGAQFAVPYVYKKLFTHEEVVFEDFPIDKSVSGNAYIALGGKFIGKIAQLYPSITGEEATRVNKEDNKVDSLNGTKGYLWREWSEFKGPEDIDMEYYDTLVTKAIKKIDSVGPSFMILDDLPEEYKEVQMPF